MSSRRMIVVGISGMALAGGVMVLAVSASSGAGVKIKKRGAAGSGAGGWRRQRVPGHQGELAGVSCPSARVCVGVGLAFAGPRGGDRTFVERWEGGRWHVQRTPN